MPTLRRPKLRFTGLLLALTLCFGMQLSAPIYAAPPPGIETVTTIEGVTEYRLANGLRVLLIPDASKPLVTANLVYLVGSKHEGPGEGGMAHLLEHLLFKGTPTTANPKDEFVKRGMQWNGQTWLDRTNYFATFNAEGDNLDWYLGWLADAMIHSHIARRDLDSEMTVVRNEFERREANFGGILSQEMMAAAYHWHPYGKPSIGSLTDIENVSIESLQQFYRRHYQPDNAVLVVAGKIDIEPTLGRIAATFGKIAKPTRKLNPIYTLEPVQEGDRALTLRRIGGVPIIAVLYHTVAGGGREAVAQAVLEYILDHEPDGRLHKALVETGLASSAYVSAQGTQDPGTLTAGIVLADSADAAKAQQALLDTLEAMPPVTAAEVERAKTAILNATNRQMLNTNQFALGLTEDIAVGDWRLAFAQRDWIKDVGAADVNRLVKAYLIAGNRTLGRYIPTAAPMRAPATTRIDSAKLLAGYQGQKAVAAVDTFAMTSEEIEAHVVKTTLPGGMKIASLKRPTKGGRVLGSLHLHWGSLDSLRGKRGDAMLLSAMMLKGTPSLSNQALQDSLNQLDATLHVHAGLMGASVDFGVPQANLPKLVELIRDIMRRPLFPQSEFEQAQRAAISANQAAQSNPNALAGIVLGHNLAPYPADDPRATWTLAQTQDAVKNATLARMQAFYQNYAGANHSELAVVGPVEPAQVATLFKNAFDDWNSSLPYVRIPEPALDNAVMRQVIETPDQANAVYLAGHTVDIEEDSADLPALDIAVELFGGRPDSRLAKRVREKDGLSYGFDSSLNTSIRDRNGVFVISGSYAPQNRAKVEAAAREELERALKDGFSAAEVETAKATVLTNRRQSLTQEQNVNALLVSNLYWERSMQLRDQRDRQYAGLTAVEVNAALRKYLKPEKLSVVVAGDFARK